LVSLYPYAHDHMRDKVWSSELDALLVSMVHGINLGIFRNVPDNSVIFGSAYQLEECLGRSFKFVETLWLYFHWHPDPMHPKHHTSLTHYCALILQKDLNMDNKAMAYETGVTCKANCVSSISQSSQSK
jgi:hypothetical protein